MSRNAHKGGRVLPDVKGHHALEGRLGRSGNVVRERAGGLDLHDRHDSNGKAKYARHHHGAPEETRDHLLVQGVVQNPGLQVGNERQKEYRGVDVVVKGELPVVVVHHRQGLLGKDRVEADKERGAQAKGGSDVGEVDLSLGPHKETADDHQEAGRRAHRRGRPEDQVAQNDVENNGEAPRNVVEGDLDPLEAEVVEGDHAHKDHREGEDLLSDGRLVLRLGELRKETVGLAVALVPGEREHVRVRGALDGHGKTPGGPANERRGDALEPRDEKGGLDRHRLAGHENFVQVDHGNGHEPVGCDHAGDVLCVSHCVMLLLLLLLLIMM
ncbi:unnamed protein product [Pseudo-nitzschia multistriata]|uniref:Uncharacterized protein n=1 Tax=Pseudo-nitzschia multistriata TaxID=183589 RepID=A0A448ZC80_9STRA|nr:unnamed protein product [Pseudo-nitzschia multistriata]